MPVLIRSPAQREAALSLAEVSFRIQPDLLLRASRASPEKHMIRGFWKAADYEPHRIAVIDADGSEISAGALLTAANQLVHGLRSKGITQGDCIAIMLPNSAAVLEVMVAVMQAGWHIVPVNTHSTADEIAYILQDSSAKAFITHQHYAESAIHAIKILEQQHTTLKPECCFAIGHISGFQDYRQFLQQQPGTLPEVRIAGHFMQYTSGTTGKPKGIQRQIYPVEPEIMADYMSSNLSRFGITPGQHVFLCPSPMYHAAPLGFNYFSLQYEHKVVIIDKWDSEEVLQLIEKYKVTTMLMVPTHFHRLLQLPEDVRNKYDLSSLQKVLHAAAPCPRETKEKMFAWFGKVIYEYYGATEGGGTLTTPEDWLRFPGTVGKAWEGAEIRIYEDVPDGVDKQLARQLGPNQIGVVYIKLTQDFNYKGDSEKTRNNRIGNFYTPGDVGYLNEEGFLFLCDRKIDMIISGGVNIYPAEIEAVLQNHPQVADVAVFGIPNKDFGEEVKAVVELKPGVKVNSVLVKQLMDYCTEKLSRYKCPRSIDFSAALPRDPNGKLYKRKLRDPYWKDEVKI
jgi:long-chain acyl-CoA synthetase